MLWTMGVPPSDWMSGIWDGLRITEWTVQFLEESWRVMWRATLPLPPRMSAVDMVKLVFVYLETVCASREGQLSSVYMLFTITRWDAPELRMTSQSWAFGGQLYNQL